MPNQYKVTANAIGPFTQGQVITDDDLAANPQFGGVARLRDELKAIEDHYDRPPRTPAPAVVEKTTGHDDPNVQKGHGRSGKS